MIEHLKQMPAWVILSTLFVLLMIGYYVRPDNLTEDAAKGVLAALLLSIQTNKQTLPPPTEPKTP